MEYGISKILNKNDILIINTDMLEFGKSVIEAMSLKNLLLLIYLGKIFLNLIIVFVYLIQIVLQVIKNQF